MYRRILVPLDGSGRAERILPHVEELAHQFRSTVFFLQVIESFSSFRIPHEPATLGRKPLEIFEQTPLEELKRKPTSRQPIL